MKTWDTIRARRNVRQYTDQPIAREDLERICEAGRRAPSAGNWQPWSFVVVTGRGRPRHRLGSLGDRRPAAGAAGTGVPRRLLFAVYLIGLGYPAGRPLRPISKPNRRPFGEVVHWNRW
jgi:nitroreductase